MVAPVLRPLSPCLDIGFLGELQRFDPGEIDPVNHVIPVLQPRAPVSTRVPSFRKSRTVLLTGGSPGSACRGIVPFVHRMPEPSLDTLSAKNMIICFCVALPNFRSSQTFSTRQLMIRRQEPHGRANSVKVLYEISAILFEFGA